MLVHALQWLVYSLHCLLLWLVCILPGSCEIYRWLSRLQLLLFLSGNWLNLNHFSKLGGIPKQMVSQCGLHFFSVICIDISTGLIIGIISTFILMLWRISRPHIAVIGLVKGTQHFRNISRHQVITSPKIFSIRIDENLSF